MLRKYRFSFCLENSITNGYISEKIFDCLYAGVIPLYLGAPNINNYVNKYCFIDLRKFNRIIPCGIRDKKITSIKEIGVKNYKNIEDNIIKNFLNVFH